MPSQARVMSGSTLRRPLLLVALLMVTAITGPACQGRRAPGDKLGPSVAFWQLSQDGFDLALSDSPQTRPRVLYRAHGWVIPDLADEPRGLYDPMVPDDLVFDFINTMSYLRLLLLDADERR